jgi:predicted double-glycine peptidase
VLSPWIETAIACVVALLGVFVGKAFSRLRSPHWVWGYFIPLFFLVLLASLRWQHYLVFAGPLTYLFAGRFKFILLAFMVTVGLATPLSRMKRRYQRALVCLIMLIVVVWFSVLPFLAPAFLKEKMLNLATTFDADGVCLQSTSYTCAPAAAVTALRRMGLEAEEGQLAVLSYTCPMTGTLPQCMSDALQNYFGPKGLQCRYRSFASVEQLKDADVTLAVIKSSCLVDHCVAVLEVSEKSVCLADPAIGKVRMSREQFEKMWRFSGIALTLKSISNI